MEDVRLIVVTAGNPLILNYLVIPQKDSAIKNNLTASLNLVVTTLKMKRSVAMPE